MKNLSKMIFPMLLLAFTLVSVNQSYAQCGTHVGSATLNQMGFGEISYRVDNCNSPMERFCVYTLNSPCPDLVVEATVTINGSFHTSGHINDTGAPLKFQATCDDEIVVTVNYLYAGQIDCIPPGSFTFSLDQV